MIHKKIQCNGELVTEVRSKGGKLLYVKTKRGYEMKCPRTKQLCVIKYEEMLSDCLQCIDDIARENLPKDVTQIKYNPA